MARDARADGVDVSVDLGVVGRFGACKGAVRKEANHQQHYDSNHESDAATASCACTTSRLSATPAENRSCDCANVCSARSTELRATSTCSAAAFRSRSAALTS